MAKAFGAIMAAVAQAQEASARAKDGAVLCPLCGGLMTNDGAGWFCYQPGTPNDTKCPVVVEKGWLYSEEIQGATFGIVVDDSDNPLAVCRGARGGGGRTNVAVSAWDHGRDGDVPGWIRQYGWTMNDSLIGASRKIIVTRHAGLVAWLKREGVTGRVVTHVMSDGAVLADGQCHESDLDGAMVYGLLPMRLAARTAKYFEVDFVIPADRRGGEFTPEEMDDWGAKLSEYSVKKVSHG